MGQDKGSLIDEGNTQGHDAKEITHRLPQVD